ncbi:MAG: hypothetical protein IKN55_06045 [Oscillospiraceae bacterium]|nr:hypothetical protein [Oscillospiraceae bacterium]
MKDVLNILRFDFLTVKTAGLVVWVTLFCVCALFSLFFGPLIAILLVIAPMGFLVPLAGVADKSGFNKLYGILPVNRKNISRGRILFIYLVQLLTELVSLAVMWLSGRLSLYQIFPNQNSTTMQMIANGFPPSMDEYSYCVYAFAAVFLLVAYLEMMGQIFGRENDMKVIMITLVVITVLGWGFFQLANMDFFPAFNIDRILDMSDQEKFRVCIAINCIVPAVAVLFAEITAAVTSRREL